MTRDIACNSRLVIPPPFGDSLSAYGWVSIGLHWLSAAVILTLWWVGETISSAGADPTGPIHLHTTIALGFYLVLWLRVIWRLRIGHPKSATPQNRIYWAISLTMHYLMVVVIAIMLLSGPLMAGWGGVPLSFFGLRLDNPVRPNPMLFGFAHSVHRIGASILISAISFHILGVMKHVIFDRDRTLDRMMVASESVEIESDDQP